MEYYEHNSDYHLSEAYQGCKFIPKNGAIWFAGIGLHRQVTRKDSVISMTWIVGDDKGNFPEVEINIPDLEEFEIKEKKYMEFNFSEHKVNPVKIENG